VKRKQKRQRIARLRKEQKGRRKSRNSVYHDAEHLVNMAESFVESDTEFVEDYSAKAGCAKKKITAFVALCVIFVVIMTSGVDIGINKTWVIIAFWITFTLVVMYLSEYSLYRSRLPFWKQQLRENTSFLNYAKARKQNLDSARAT